MTTNPQPHPLDLTPVSYDADAYARAVAEKRASAERPAPPHRAHPRYANHMARDFMTPGVTTITEDASLHQAYRAMAEHRVNALLVLNAKTGAPRGWVTARGVLEWLGRDSGLIHVGRAVSEPAVSIRSTATVDDAVAALSGPGVSHVLVTRSHDRLPEGVVSPLDLVRLAAR